MITKVNKIISTSQWIEKNTFDSKCVVEMGAGRFNRLASVNSNVEQKIGIEIYDVYIKNAWYNDCIQIEGNVLNYRELLKGYDLDTVLIVDVIEHLYYDDAVKWMDMLKEDFRKILLMLPVGDFPHNVDIYGLGGDEYQTHRSSWYEEHIEKLEFNENIICLNYYEKLRNVNPEDNFDTGCYFGIWEK